MNCLLRNWFESKVNIYKNHIVNKEPDLWSISKYWFVSSNFFMLDKAISICF